MTILESLVEELSQKQWVCSSSYIQPNLAQALYEEAQYLYEQGHTRAAHVGQGQGQQQQTQIRSNRIHWFEPEQLSSPQAAFCAQMELVRQQLNETCYLNLYDFECHYTIYPPGTFYRRHLDQFRQDNRRQLSCLLYLNPNWQPEDGGMLRIYLPTEQPDFVEISPNLGNFVMFRSNLLEHEVMPTQRTRYGAVGWMRNRPIQPHLLRK